MAIQFVQVKHERKEFFKAHYLAELICKKKTLVFSLDDENTKPFFDYIVDNVEDVSQVTASLLIAVKDVKEIIDYLAEYSDQAFDAVFIHNIPLDEKDISLFKQISEQFNMEIMSFYETKFTPGKPKPG